jgi:hypothetical protein
MSKIKDLDSWLRFYGEPQPDKIPTGATSIYLSVSIYLHLSIYLSIYIYLSIFPSFYLSLLLSPPSRCPHQVCQSLFTHKQTYTVLPI